MAGRPNAGKSTLINSLCGEKISIVTNKPQTTRDRILGIKTTAFAQMIFIDTPGLHSSQGKPLNRKMMKEAIGAIHEADVLLFLAGPSMRDIDKEIEWIENIKKTGKPIIVAVNKIDLVEKDRFLPVIKRFSEIGIEKIIPVSALKGDGVDALEREIAAILPASPPLYPEDTLTQQTERFLTSEIIREKLFQFTRQEIPYSSLVSIDDFKERSKKLSVVFATIYVEKESQKGIVIGQRGSMIKRIGWDARKELEERFGRKFYLELRVKTRKEWTKDEKFIDTYATNVK